MEHPIHRNVFSRREDSSATPPPEPPLLTPVPLNPRGSISGGPAVPLYGSPAATPPALISPPNNGRFYSPASVPNSGTASPRPVVLLASSAPNRVISGSPAISDVDDDEGDKKQRRFRPQAYPTFVAANGGGIGGSIFGGSTRRRKLSSRFADIQWWTWTVLLLLRWALYGYVLMSVVVFSGLVAFGVPGDSVGSSWLDYLPMKISRTHMERNKEPRVQEPDDKGRELGHHEPSSSLTPDIHPTVPRLPASIRTLRYDSSYMFRHLSDTLGPRTVSQKLFQFALKPFEIMAFYERATVPPSNKTISIATLIDPSRFGRLTTLARMYNGHLSVALQLAPEEVERQIAKLRQLIQSDANVREKCDFHLVITPHPRQLNLLRNVARFFARTELVVQLDADFVASTDIAEHVDRLSLREKVLSGDVALVLPAFEWAEGDAAKGDNTQTEPSLANWPQTKEEVLGHFNGNRLLIFHHQWAVGHAATDYVRWKTAREPYEVVEAYHHSYEPYLVMRRDFDGSGVPFCDERLVGYGGNKAACVFEGHVAGVRLLVMPNDWVIHQR